MPVADNVSLGDGVRIFKPDLVVHQTLNTGLGQQSIVHAPCFSTYTAGTGAGRKGDLPHSYAHGFQGAGCLFPHSLSTTFMAVDVIV